MLPTSHDVARLAGVSQATVSRALREHHGVARATRDRVREAARSLGYVPSSTARALSTRRTGRIAVVCSGLDDPFHAALVAPLHDALSDRGLQTVLVTDTDEHPVTIDDLLDGACDGVVLTTCSTTSPLPAALAARAVPCVIADRAVEDEGTDSCVVDDRAGAASVADLLVELGHRRIGVIAGPDTISTGRDRLTGFLDQLGRHGITVATRGIHTGPFTAETGRRGLVALLAAGPSMPTAVFCGNDVIALGALEAAAQYGVAVPGDLVVIGFGGLPIARWERVGLTTMDVDLAAMAREVTEMLVERLDGVTVPARTVKVPARLAARRTHESARPQRADCDEDRAAPPEPEQGLRRWMTATSELARAVNSATPTTTVLALIARRACDLIGFDFCAVMLANAGEECLSVAGFHGLDANYVGLVSDEQALQIRPESSDQDSPAARAFRERRTVAVTDTRSAAVYGRLRDLAPAQGYRSLVAAPLRDASGSVSGLIVGYLQEPHVFSAEELDLTELLGEQIMVVLETDRLRRAQERTIAELSAVNTQMSEARRQLDWAEEQHERLMQLVLDGAGLEGLTDALAEILDAAITVQNADGDVLAQSGGRAPIAPSAGAEPDATGDAAWTVPVLVTGETVGRLWISRMSSRPDPLQRRAIERFALVVGVEIFRRRHLEEVRQRFTRDVLSELLRPSGPVHVQSVLEHAASLGVELDEPHLLVLICRPRSGPAPGLLQDCRKALATVERCLVGQYDGDVVAVLPAELDVGRTLEPLLTRLGRTAPPHAPVVVLAPEAESPTDYAGAYRIARGVARLRLATNSVVPFVDARRLGVAALLLGEDLPSPRLAQFAEGLLAPLERAGAVRQGELVATLRAWLEHGCSAATTADALTVHPNTVTYRLNRLEKLLGLDLRSFENRLNLQLALTVVDVSGQVDAGRTSAHPGVGVGEQRGYPPRVVDER
ncbi:substrate-binding domain-containing protein [Actinomycetospora endophytica]|uniref:Substrate-binding domain-containing protein n=1 Tax=Actinomycetospora endophytica TaxID=2291215 RepID=A0ABS8P1C5_9PSEU|nr:substrate-binding domain-containing protein [Actinomycetospora endophytica]MCD2191863.1 substrate-binding domain-containing protein [Actinomycetospora endophytica]